MIKKHKNVEFVSDLCTSCGTCAGVCPISAIEIYKRRDRYIVQIDSCLCNGCGICLNMCPGYSIDYKTLNISIFGKEPFDHLIGNYVGCYTGNSTDFNIRYNSTSGGMITQVLIFALENDIIDGALVTRMSKENPLEPEVFIAQTKEEIISASGSKYCPVTLNKVVKEILKYDGKIAVVGLPCHINGLRKMEHLNKKLKEKIWLHLGIFCSRNDGFIATEFWLNWFGIKSSEVEKINYRTKGWPGYMSIKIKGDKSEKSIPYKKWICVHQFRLFTPKSCLLCPDLTCELSDISFGDAWLPEIKKSERIGMSICISRNKYSDELLKNAMSEGVISLNPENADIVRRSQGTGKKCYSKVASNIYSFFGKNVQIYIAPFADNTVPKKFHYLIFLLYSFQSYILSRRIFWRYAKVLLPFEQYIMEKLVKLMI